MNRWNIRLMPPEAKALLAIAKTSKAQGSLEYIMMLAAASLVVAIALAMLVKLRGAATSNLAIGNVSVDTAISRQLGSITQGLV